ncbi:hypothetical protein NKG94_21470 [Micromonospora sp. M12]
MAALAGLVGIRGGLLVVDVCHARAVVDGRRRRFSFAPIDDDHRSSSILEGSPVEVTAPLMAVLGLLGTVVSLAMVRGAGSRRQSAAMIAFGWIVAVCLTLIIPDYILIALLAFGPLLLVFTFTGVPGPRTASVTSCTGTAST